MNSENLSQISLLNMWLLVVIHFFIRNYYVVRKAKSDKPVSDPNIFSWIAVFVADSADINSNCFKILLANGLSKVFIKDNLVFSNGPKSLRKNPPDSPILCNWVSDSFY